MDTFSIWMECRHGFFGSNKFKKEGAQISLELPSIFYGNLCITSNLLVCEPTWFFANNWSNSKYMHCILYWEAVQSIVRLLFQGFWNNFVCQWSSHVFLETTTLQERSEGRHLICWKAQHSLCGCAVYWKLCWANFAGLWALLEKCVQSNPLRILDNPRMLWNWFESRMDKFCNKMGCYVWKSFVGSFRDTGTSSRYRSIAISREYDSVGLPKYILDLPGTSKDCRTGTECLFGIQRASSIGKLK